MTVTAAIVRPLLGFVGDGRCDSTRTNPGGDVEASRDDIRGVCCEDRLSVSCVSGHSGCLGHFIECGGGIGSATVRVGLKRGRV